MMYLVSMYVTIGNQIRSLLLEDGITIKEGRTHLVNQVPNILEDAENELSNDARLLISELFEEYKEVEKRKQKYDQRLELLAKTNEVCKRLTEVPGVGPITSTLFVAAVGNPNSFKNGRQVAAWLGLVPRQVSTGGKTRLLGITKRGDCALRSLLVHGGRSKAVSLVKKTNRTEYEEKIFNMLEKKGYNKTAVAIANRNARIMWALMKSGENYKVS